MKAYRLTALLLLALVANPALAVRRFTGTGYVVKPSDTCSAICEKFAMTPDEFAALNPNINVDAVSGGQRVMVRSAHEPAPADTSAVSSKPLATHSGRYYVVKSHDTASDICKKYGLSLSEFAALNSGMDINVLRRGRVVKVASAAQQSMARTEEPTSSIEPKVAVQPAAKKPLVKKIAKPKTGGYLSGYYNDPTKRANKSEPSVAASVLRVVGALLFVVALAVLSLFALKHFGSNNKLIHKSLRRSIKVIETAGLGPNRNLHVVQAGNKYLLLGSTPNEISLVAELDEAEAEDSDPQKAVDFASILRRSSSAEDRADSASKLSETIRDGASFLQKKSSAARAMRSKAESDES